MSDYSVKISYYLLLLNDSFKHVHFIVNNSLYMTTYKAYAWFNYYMGLTANTKIIFNNKIESVWMKLFKFVLHIVRIILISLNNMNEQDKVQIEW